MYFMSNEMNSCNILDKFNELQNDIDVIKIRIINRIK